MVVFQKMSILEVFRLLVQTCSSYINRRPLRLVCAVGREIVCLETTVKLFWPEIFCFLLSGRSPKGRNFCGATIEDEGRLLIQASISTAALQWCSSSGHRSELSRLGSQSCTPAVIMELYRNLGETLTCSRGPAMVWIANGMTIFPLWWHFCFT